MTKAETAGFDALDAWFETAVALNAAITTISLRTMGLAMPSAGQKAGIDPETQRMVVEKIDAATEGSREMQMLWLKMAMMPLSIRYADVPNLGAMMAMAYVRPGYARARANARRLTRRD